MIGVLYNLFITPIEYILEFVYVFLDRILNDPGLVIIGVSLVVNLLILPIYMRADAIQETENNRQKQMKPWLDRIRTSFSGDERFMMLQAYYREADYKPVYALKTLLPTILQVPFFIAAYHFLSNLRDLDGASFGLISDLSQPDALIHLGNVSLNVLPILMTIVNMGSALVYLRGYPLKNKVQTYLLALIFLFLLYESPSGLVFYWLLNNVFSLVKNLLMNYIPKITKKEKTKELKKRLGLADILPAQLILTVLIGMVVPAALISASATEFVVVADPRNPMHYIMFTLELSAGYFCVWFSVFYFIAPHSMRKIFCVALNTISVLAVTDYMFFGKNLGIISADLYFTEYPSFSVGEKIINLAVIIVLISFLTFFWKKYPGITQKLYWVLLGALIVTSVRDISQICKEISDNPHIMEKHLLDDSPVFSMSRTGKNVVILSMDAMVGTYVPFIFAEKPELKDEYEGFTYYPDTVTTGFSTATGSPAMLGGYEYAPYNSDKREDVTLEEKVFEYTTLMPRLFADAGWNVTACDIPYAGYNIASDMSDIDSIEGVNGINVMGYYVDQEIIDKGEKVRKRNLFWYGIFKIAPVFAQTTIYDGGIYFSSEGISDLNGLYASHFMGAYEVMHRLDRLTGITDDNINTLLIMNNDTAHENVKLRLPEYEPSNDTTKGETDPGYRTDDEGNTFYMSEDGPYQNEPYHVNMAAFIQIGRWLEYLKTQEVYDNTRIIIVSDHGRPIEEFPELGNPQVANLEQLNCVLLVKDFNEHGELAISDEFMCNADTPVIAMNGLIDDPINPYTGNPIDSSPKDGWIEIMMANDFSLPSKDLCKYFFKEMYWVRVKDSIFISDNWENVDK